MPKRDDIKSIMIIGAGPIVIGQACEFDYSGTQACKALKDEGYRIILVNSNPATIMTDPDLAHATYIEPITPEIVARIIEKERPDALLPTMGGQTALNTALSLRRDGVLKKFNVELIGAKADAIDKAEDRDLFRKAMTRIGLETPTSAMVHNMAEAQAAIDLVGLPAIIRPSFTLGGTGGGIAYNKSEYYSIIEHGLDASPTTEVLVEESVLGWKEYEMEVVRDKADNCIIVCSIENIDPMGVHTGDSITVAPALTLTDKEYQIMRNASIAVLREIGVETGGSNVQFAVNPENGKLIVIEMNPRVSRSSALASKATGFPIAKIAAKLAVGYTLDELDNDITGGATPASFEPSIDYVVTKIPRFAFEKFPGAEPYLTTSMESVGEAMAIGRNFAESLQKALRSLETGLSGLDDYEFNFPDSLKQALAARSNAMAHLEEGELAALGGQDAKNIIREALGSPTPERLLQVAEAMRLGFSNESIHAACKIDPWFLRQIRDIIDMEAKVIAAGLPETANQWTMLKSMGFADARLAKLAGISEKSVMEQRRHLGIAPVFKRIDTCAAEFAAPTAYMYSAYEHAGDGKADCESRPSDAKKVVILGGGPNRIGQGIEFDYCCCHASFALKDAGFESIMVNCNPETVSTDYDTSDRLYFEPLTGEDVIELITKEQESGELLGVIVQFGGQTPLNLARRLEAAGIPILGTSPDAIDLAEDRDRFKDLLDKLGLKQPNNGIATTGAQAKEIAERIGYPVVIRPSYVLGGRAMEIVRDTAQLERYITQAVIVSGDSPVLIDGYLSDAIEVDVDALCDGSQVHVCGIMEHIEEAGVHSGDSACALPPHSLDEAIIDEIRRQTAKMALALNVNGLMNVQYAVKDDVVYVLEVNPRASRTVPFVAKATGIAIAKIAARIMAGASLDEFDLTPGGTGHIAIKEAVFPFARFPGVDTLLGPEMRSTGEVMGLDYDFSIAFAKSQLAAGEAIPKEGTAFISVKDADKQRILLPAKALADLGFKLLATSGTQRYLSEQGLDCDRINKVLEGRPHIVDAIRNGDIHIVINTTQGSKAISDSRSMRRAALMQKVPYYTTHAAASAAVKAITALSNNTLDVRPLQDYVGKKG